MVSRLSPHLRAVLQALLVTFLWSTSWVLIKIGLKDIPALTFAGLRYTLAFVCLLPVVWRSGHLAGIRSLPRADWRRLLGLGLLMYGVTQGAQFISLDYLPAMTLTLLLNFTTVVVALLGIALLAERPTWMQWAGIALYLLGVLVYFTPLSIPARQVTGLVVALVCVGGNALATVFGRGINRRATIPPLVVTAISMGIGAVALLIAGIAVQGMPALTVQGWAIIGWLAVVNTAFAFTLWNHTQRTLPAVESSIINNTMLIQIALLAWLFLDEDLTGRKIAGMALAGIGTLIVQLRRARTA